MLLLEAFAKQRNARMEPCRRGEDVGCKTVWFSFVSFSAAKRMEARD